MARDAGKEKKLLGSTHWDAGVLVTAASPVPQPIQPQGLQVGAKSGAAKGEGGLAGYWFCLLTQRRAAVRFSVPLSDADGTEPNTTQGHACTRLLPQVPSRQRGEGRVQEILRSLHVLGDLVERVSVRSSVKVETAIRVTSLGCWGSEK